MKESLYKNYQVAFGHLEKVYPRLKPAEKKVLQLSSIIYFPLTKTDLYKASYRCGIKNDNGKAFNSNSFKTIILELDNKGLLVFDGNWWKCHPQIVNEITLRSVEEGTFGTLMAHVRELYPLKIGQDIFSSPMYTRYDYKSSIREFRAGLYTADMIALAESIDILSEHHPEEYSTGWAWEQFCNSPFRPRWFRELPVPLQVVALKKIIPAAVMRLDPIDDIYALLKEYRDHPDGDMRYYARTEWQTLSILRGKWKEAREQELPMDIPLSYCIKGWMEVVAGNHEAAGRLYEDGVKLLRKNSRKKKNYFYHLSSLFYFPTLVKIGNPDTLSAMGSTLSRKSYRESGYYGSYEAFNALVLAGRGQAEGAKALFFSQKGRYDGFSLLFHGLTAAWYFAGELKFMKDELTDAFSRARENGYSWLAMEYAMLLTQLKKGANAKPFRHYAQEKQKELEVRSLFYTIEREEPWKQSLKALSRVCGKPVESGAPASSRLAWFIEMYRYDIDIAPKEQVLGARGTWSKGRAVSLQRLKEGKLACMTPRDHKVAATIEVDMVQSYGYYNKKQYYLDVYRALAALVGHPLLFMANASGEPLELKATEPELVIKPVEKGIEVTFSPHVEDKAIVLMQDSPTSYSLVKLTDPQRQVAKIVGPGGLQIPSGGKVPFLELMKNLSSVITVHSHLEEQREDIHTVTADASVYARLSPLGEGINVELRVKPFGPEGPYYSPGEGAANVIAHIGGKPVQARRDLTGESVTLRTVVEQCPTLDRLWDGSVIWELETPDTALEALLELKRVTGGLILEWPEGEKLKIPSEVSFSQLKVNIKRDRDWFALSGELQVDESRVLPLRRMLEMLETAPSRFLPLGDGEFLALTEAFRARLMEFAGFSGTSAGDIRIHPLAALTLEDFWEEPVQVSADKDWKEVRERIRSSYAYNPEIPSTLQAELRGYQVEGFKWLARLAYLGVGACLADDMGLGKTVQALALILGPAPKGPVLVVAPKSVCFNWINEVRRFASTLNPILFGGKERKELLEKLEPFDLVVCSYGLLQQEPELLASVHWEVIVLDEAQAIKNAATRRSKAAMGLTGNFKMITTGTPIENHLGELWNLFRFINPGLLGSWKHFSTVFAGPIERDKSATVGRRLKKLLQPYILRRRKDQVLQELPEKTEVVLRVDLDEQEAAFYEALRLEALKKIQKAEGPKMQKRIKVLAEIMRLRRACCHPRLLVPEIEIGGSKLALFGELVAELLESRHKALVFSQFTGHLAIIREYLDKEAISYQYLDGRTSLKDRQARVNAFQAGEGDVFLISLRAGGVGLNLTAANYVIHMDPWWNPAVEDQASDRAHRIGQRLPVTVYRLVTGGTIEEKMLELHQGKRELADSLLTGTEGSSALSFEQLVELIGSGEGAVS